MGPLKPPRVFNLKLGVHGIWNGISQSVMYRAVVCSYGLAMLTTTTDMSVHIAFLTHKYNVNSYAMSFLAPNLDF